MLQLDAGHRGRGLIAVIAGLVLGAIGAVIVSKVNPALSTADSAVVSIGLFVFLIGALLVLLGIAYWLAGLASNWPVAIGNALLVALAVALVFVVVPAMWMSAMRLLGPQWAKELVSLVYLAVMSTAVMLLLRSPRKKTGPSGVSAYGRTLIRR